jgi:mono/diheme cytochrome c family protein
MYQITRRDMPTRSERPNLASASNADLVALLASPSGWWRDTAQRLLIERGATDQADSLRILARNPNIKTSITALHALWTLDALGQLNAAEITLALKHPIPAVRAAAAQIAQNWMGDESVAAAVGNLATDPDASRLVLLSAFPTLASTFRGPDHAALQAQLLLTHQRDPFLRSALWTANPTVCSITAMRLASEARVQAPLLREIVAAGIRGSEDFRVMFLNAAVGGPLAEQAIPLIAKELKLDDPRPPRLALKDEPAILTSLQATANLSSSAREIVTRMVAQMDWPGKGAGSTTITLRDLTPIEKTRFELGKSLYSTCASCHGVDGKGQPGQAPPIAGSKRINGPEGVLVRIILQGVRGEYEVNGQTFTGEMPIPQITEDEELASVLTYVRRAFGNRADPISPETIAQIREETAERSGSWTHKELDELAR